MTILSKPILCKDCEDETERIQSNNLFEVIDCKPDPGQEHVPPDARTCTIRWQRKQNQ